MQTHKPRDQRYMKPRTIMVDKIFNDFSRKISNLDSVKRVKALRSWQDRDFDYPKALTGSERRKLRQKISNEILKIKQKKTT